MTSWLMRWFMACWKLGASRKHWHIRLVESPPRSADAMGRASGVCSAIALSSRLGQDSLGRRRAPVDSTTQPNCPYTQATSQGSATTANGGGSGSVQPLQLQSAHEELKLFGFAPVRSITLHVCKTTTGRALAEMTPPICMAAFVAAFMTVTGSARAAARIPTHVACVGDSITQGVGASSGNTSYPADLQALFGSSVQVKNFGHSGATMLSVGDLPYQQQSEYASATTFVSGAGSGSIVDVVIMLGTNDSKPYNWTVGTSTRAEQFRTDCAAMVDHFAQIPTHPLVYLALPPHAYANSYQIDGTVIHDQILPILREVATAKGIPIVDVDAPTTGHPELFPDGVHPNDAGHKILAQTIHDGLLASVDGTGGSGGGGSGGGGAGGAAGAGGGGGGAAGRGSGGGPAGGAAGSGHGGSSGAGGSSSGSADAAIAPGAGGKVAGSTGSGGSGSGGFAGSVGGSGSGGAASAATGGAAGIGAGGSGGASGSMGGAAGIGAGGSGGAASGSTGGTAGVAAGGMGGSASHPMGGASPVTSGGAAGNGGGDSSRGCSCAVSAPNEGRRSGWPILLLVGGALALACRARSAAPSESCDCRLLASGRNSKASAHAAHPAEVAHSEDVRVPIVEEDVPGVAGRAGIRRGRPETLSPPYPETLSCRLSVPGTPPYSPRGRAIP